MEKRAFILSLLYAEQFEQAFLLLLESLRKEDDSARRIALSLQGEYLDLRKKEILRITPDDEIPAIKSDLKRRSIMFVKTVDFDPPFKVLFIAANPRMLTALKLGRLYQKIAAEVNYDNAVNRIHFNYFWSPEIKEIKKKIDLIKPQIVHCVGTGPVRMTTVLSGNDSHHSTHFLNSLIHVFNEKSFIEGVYWGDLLSSDEIDWVSKLINFPFIIFKGILLTEDLERSFSNDFYQSLKSGSSIQKSFDLGRKAFGPSESPLETIPILLSSASQKAE